MCDRRMGRKRRSLDEVDSKQESDNNEIPRSVFSDVDHENSVTARRVKRRPYDPNCYQRCRNRGYPIRYCVVEQRRIVENF